MGPENRRTTTTWTSPPNVSWQQRQAPGGFHLESDQTNTGLDLFLLGSSDTTQHLLRGSSRPFAGWQLEHGVPVPASALVVDQPAKNSWAATIWIWQNAGPGYEGSPQMAEWTDVTHWEMQLPGEAETVVLRREGNVLRLHSGGKIDETLQLTGTSSDVDGAITELRRQFMASSSRYLRRLCLSSTLARGKGSSRLGLACKCQLRRDNVARKEIIWVLL